jgi:hypothetical protein
LAADPLNRPPISFATVTATFATSATKSVLRFAPAVWRDR